MTKTVRERLESLEAENRVLREENLLFAEHAEESMLLRTVAEIAGWNDDADALLNEVLERFSLLRAIPFCASGWIAEGQIRLPWCYSSFSAADCRAELTLPVDLVERLTGRGGMVVQLPAPGCSLVLPACDFVAGSLLLLSFSTHHIERGLFAFASQEQGEIWAGSQVFLRQAVDTIAARLDRLDLVKELRGLNRELDQRVRERTRELQRSNQDLAQLQSLFENIVDSMPSVLIGVDAEGAVLQWNLEAARVSGCSFADAKGQPLGAVFPELDKQLTQVDLAIRGQKVLQSRRVCMQTAAGEELLTDITVYPLVTNGIEGAVIRIDDVTERVRLEEVMIQAEKMLSVGGLAAGMAHEINNPLAGILQNLQVALSRLTLPRKKNLEIAEACGVKLDAVEAYLEQRGIVGMLNSAVENGRRAAGIVDNILSFSRQVESQQAPRDLADLLERTIALLDNDYNLEKGYDFRKISIQREYEQGIPAVPCEETKIQQVLLNILRNGAQAMGSSPTGRPRCFKLKLSRVADMVQIEIRDNGPGMSDEVIRRAFEPFFTTKGVRGGTGLGLSVSYFIVVEQHGGELVVESTPGEGSCFFIRLPVSGRPARANPFFA